MPAEKESADLGTYEYWHEEYSIASKELKDKFHSKGDRVIDKLLDNGGADDPGESMYASRLNLFHSNIVTLSAMLYGQDPRVDVDRRHKDTEDDVARVATEMLERILNNDIALDTDGFLETIRYSLNDYLVPGLGCARVRYSLKTTTDGGEERMVEESAPVDYVHWKDFLWSPARVWDEVRWVGFRTFVSKEEATKRWSASVAKKLPYTSQRIDDDEKDTDPSKRAEVWEIWCKETKKIYWFCAGYEKLLGSKPDPLKLSGFFPTVRPLAANVTSKKFLPKPNYAFAQDLYEEVDELNSRIRLLTQACKAVGVYDKSADGVQRVFNEGVDNKLIPVDSWAMFAEKGGISGAVDWVPIEPIAKVIDILTAKLTEKMNLLYQVTGMSDILRGATDPRETKGAQELKSRFASVRIQKIQDEFAEFVSDLQKLKTEIISRHFSPETILQQSNIMKGPQADLELVGPAIELIKNPEALAWRIVVRPESVAMVDYAQLKQERTEYVNALALFMQSAAPLVEQSPEATPTLLELLKWGLAGFKGSNQIEGVLDRAILEATKSLQAKAQQPPPPDPKLEAAKLKAQTDQQKAMVQMQQDQQKFALEMRQSQQEHALKMQEMQAQLQFLVQKMLIETQGAREKVEVDRELADIKADAAEEQASIKADAARQMAAAKPKESKSNGA